MKNFVYLLVAIVLFSGGVFIGAQNIKAGAVAGPYHYNEEFFLQPVTIGGNVYATTTATTTGVIYTQAIVKNTSLIEHTASSTINGANASLAASSTLRDLILKPGDKFRFCIKAIGNSVTLTGGTGTTLTSASTTAIIVAGKVGCVEEIRTSTRDVEATLTLFN